MENKKLKLLKLKAKAAKAKLALMKINADAPDSKVQEWLQVAANHIKELAATEKYKGLTSATDGSIMKIFADGKVIGAFEGKKNHWNEILFRVTDSFQQYTYISTAHSHTSTAAAFKKAIFEYTDRIVEHALYPDTNDRSAEFAELAAGIVSQLSKTDEYKDKGLKVGISDCVLADERGKKIEIRGKIKNGSKLIGVITIYHTPKWLSGDDYSIDSEVKNSSYSGWGSGVCSKKENIKDVLTHHILHILKGIYGNN